MNQQIIEIKSADILKQVSRFKGNMPVWCRYFVPAWKKDMN